MPYPVAAARSKNFGGVWLLPQNLQSSAGTLLLTFEDNTAFTIAGTGATKADNTTEYKQGAVSVKFTSPTGTTVGRLIKATGISWDLSAMNEVSLWFYCHDANTSSIQLQLGNGGGITAGFEYTFLKHTGWNYVHALKTDFATVGAGSWATAIDFFRLNVTGTSGNVTEVSFDSFYASTTRAPALVLTWDDSDPTAYTEGFAYMDARGLNATMYVITDNIDDVGNISTVQLDAMYAAGWDIGNHTTTGASLSGESQGTCETNIGDAETALISAGWTRAAAHVSYPGGFYDATVLAAMAAQSMLSGRTITELGYPILPQDDWYRLQLGKQFGNTITLAAAKTWIDGLVTRKEIGIGLFHKLVASPADATEWAIADFQALIDYAMAAGLPFLTISQLYALGSGSVIYG